MPAPVQFILFYLHNAQPLEPSVVFMATRYQIMSSGWSIREVGDGVLVGFEYHIWVLIPITRRSEVPDSGNYAWPTRKPSRMEGIT